MRLLNIFKKVIKLLVALYLIQAISVLIAYGIIVNKPHKYDKNLTPGICFYDTVKDKLKREELEFFSEGHKISAYFYDNEEQNDNLIITVHGYADKSDYLILHQMFFLEKGFDVFSFDLSGFGMSKGNFDGFSQSLIDVDYALNFIENDIRFNHYNIYLFGFSAGGYGVSSSLALKHKNIKGVAAVSAYNDAKNLVLYKEIQHVGKIANLTKPIIYGIEKIKFHKYLDITSKKAIDSCSVPVFLAHGTKDRLITYKDLSLAHYYEGNNRAKLYKEDCDHSELLFSQRARLYKKECDKEIKKLSGKKRLDYVNSIDDNLYSEINLALFEEIVAFYKSCM